VDLQQTRTTRNREAMRWVAGASSSGAFISCIYGLIRPQPFASDYLWLAGISLLGILLTWVVVETLVACKDEVIAKMPKAHQIVAATLREKEKQDALDAGLPYIAGGERTR